MKIFDGSCLFDRDTRDRGTRYQKTQEATVSTTQAWDFTTIIEPHVQRAKASPGQVITADYRNEEETLFIPKGVEPVDTEIWRRD